MARDSPLHEGLSRLLPHAIDLLERNEGVPLAPRARFGAGPGRRSDGCIGTQSSGSRESQTKPRAKGTSDPCGKYAEGWDAPRRAPCIHFWKRPLGRLPHQVGDAHVAPQRGAELREALRSARLPRQIDSAAFRRYARELGSLDEDIIGQVGGHSTISTDTRTTSVASPVYFKCEYGLSK